MQMINIFESFFSSAASVNEMEGGQRKSEKMKKMEKITYIQSGYFFHISNLFVFELELKSLKSGAEELL